MSLTDAIVASIEAELQALKETTPIPATIVISEPMVPVVVPAPVTSSNPILQMAIDQAAFRLARETAK